MVCSLSSSKVSTRLLLKAPSMAAALCKMPWMTGCLSLTIEAKSRTSDIMLRSAAKPSSRAHGVSVKMACMTDVTAIACEPWIMTLQPNLASLLAVSLPMPRVEPVMKKVRSPIGGKPSAAFAVFLSANVSACKNFKFCCGRVFSMNVLLLFGFSQSASFHLAWFLIFAMRSAASWAIRAKGLRARTESPKRSAEVLSRAVLLLALKSCCSSSRSIGPKLVFAFSPRSFWPR
mmetsp:Transcript_80642/g.231552  ORF Transcript_80642/g.231552 Transcript_80642/m.231552 type:complete len:232 (+) Transcript_80642:1204-1899(+)